MCGIIGYKGKNSASEILLNGLRMLEYRGYDSVGMSILSNNKIITEKDVGKVDEVNVKVNFLKLQGNIGIAHTRWATHGGVTVINSHPHVSSDENISVVHNGIIENYSEIKKTLESKGIKFCSETDTEVIPKLIEYFMRIGEDFETAFVKMLKEIKGTYAILAMSIDGDFCFAREGSPLIIGLSENEIFFASDTTAFLERTNKVIYLDDGDFGFYDKELTIMNSSGAKTLKIEELNWTLEQATKNNYPHFMIKEINEQSETIRKASNQSKELIESVRSVISNSKNIFLLGCGTSYHACLAGRYYFASKGINSTAILASEFKSWKNFFKDHA
ncbi:MAG: SIS domain-containing protein [Nanoarchaeota archaeon]